MSYKIMIVEDEVLIGMMIKKQISSRGYEVCEIPTTGEQAILSAEVEKPDLIIMDIILAGELTGIEAAKVIKEKCDIPIVFFSGNNNDRRLIEESKGVSNMAIVNKLGSIGELFESIELALKS